MTFAVTYRGADGAPVTEAVEAASRAECLAKMKARGVSVLGVKEGNFAGNSRKSSRPKASMSSRKAVTAPIIAIVAVAAILGVGIWWWRGGTRTPRPAEPEVPKKAALAKEVKPAAAPKPLEPVPVTNAVPDENPNKALRKEIAKLTKEERRNLAFEEMQKQKIPLSPKTNRIFRTGIEASMARIFMTRLGDPPPPMFTTVVPLRDEAHLAEILIATNPVLDTDTEAQRESKEMVALAKKEMIDYIKNGGHPEDFLKYYHGKLQEAFDLRRESAKSFMALAREDPSVAGEYLERLNKELADKGIKQIELNEKQRKRLGLE